MGRGKGARQPFAVLRHRNQMYMIRHQAIGPQTYVVVPQLLEQKTAVVLVVEIAKEDLHPPRTPLGDVVRGPRDHDARDSSHLFSLI